MQYVNKLVGQELYVTSFKKTNASNYILQAEGIGEVYVGWTRVIKKLDEMWERGVTSFVATFHKELDGKTEVGCMDVISEQVDVSADLSNCVKNAQRREYWVEMCASAYRIAKDAVYEAQTEMGFDFGIYMSVENKMLVDCIERAYNEGYKAGVADAQG